MFLKEFAGRGPTRDESRLTGEQNAFITAFGQTNNRDAFVRR